MAKDGNKNKGHDPIVCQRDGDGWLARDLDTGDFAYGPTEKGALRALLAAEKQSRFLASTSPTSPEEVALAKSESLRTFLERFILEIRFASNLFWQTAKINLPEQVEALRDRRKIRGFFHKIFNAPGLLNALALSESEDSAVLSLLMIMAIVGIASNSLATPQFAVEALDNLALREDEITASLKTSIANIQQMTDLSKSADPNIPNPLTEQKSILAGMLEQHEIIQRFIALIRDSPIRQAGLLAKKGGAAKNPDSAARSAIVRALDQCIPSRYNRENGFYRFALIKDLLAIAGIESNNQLIRSLIHG